MARVRLLDTCAWVALLHGGDRRHADCVAAVEGFRGELLTTEAVLAETAHLMRRVPGGTLRCLDFVLRRGALLVAADAARVARCRELIAGYADVPMDYADATLVALAEEANAGEILTLDRRGFSTYRWRRTRRFTMLP